MNTLIPISIKVVICWLFAGYLLVGVFNICLV